MTKKAVLYARVSTDDQADRGYSLPSQLDLGRKYAERLGYEIIAEVCDDHSGATPIAERPRGKQLASMVRARTIDAIIVYQVDRLSRDIVDLLATVRLWLRAGIEIHTCNIGKIESELDIVLVIKGWQGSDERKRIIERTSRGRRSKATGGLVVGQGFSPYGYEFERVTVNGNGRPVVVGLVIVEEEGRIVRLIFGWYVLGEEKNKPVPTLEICRRLQAMCVPVPSKRHFWGDRKSVWSPTILYKILKNETYAGIWRWGKNIGAGGRGGQRPVAEQVAINVPAIVDRNLWDAAQMKLEYNRQVSKRGAHYFYLLRSMIRCGECGRRMVGHYVRKSKMTDPRYYRCTSIGETWRKRTCKQKMVRAGEVEAAVWDYVLRLVKGGDFEKKIRDAQADRFAELEPKRDELETVAHLITNCDAEAAELARAVARVDEGVVRRKLAEQVKEIDARYNALIKRRDELQAELSAPDLKEENIAAALQFRGHVLLGIHYRTLFARLTPM